MHDPLGVQWLQNRLDKVRAGHPEDPFRRLGSYRPVCQRELPDGGSLLRRFLRHSQLVEDLLREAPLRKSRLQEIKPHEGSEKQPVPAVEVAWRKRNKNECAGYGTDPLFRVHRAPPMSSVRSVDRVTFSLFQRHSIFDGEAGTTWPHLANSILMAIRSRAKPKIRSMMTFERAVAI